VNRSSQTETAAKTSGERSRDFRKSRNEKLLAV
jgi:hypothetical protein